MRQYIAATVNPVLFSARYALLDKKRIVYLRQAVFSVKCALGLKSSWACSVWQTVAKPDGWTRRDESDASTGVRIKQRAMKETWRNVWEQWHSLTPDEHSRCNPPHTLYSKLTALNALFPYLSNTHKYFTSGYWFYERDTICNPQHIQIKKEKKPSTTTRNV